MKTKIRLIAILISLFAGFLFLSLTLSKDSDDEMIYTALASKLQATGLSSYNHRDISIDTRGEFWELSYLKNGNLLSLLSKTGITYYDTALFFNPPLFPVVLAASHLILNSNNPYLALKRNNEHKIYFEQLYSSFPNAALGVLFLLGIFLLARNLFSEKTAWMALCIALTSPVFLVVIFKVWTDLLASTLLLWSFYLWHKRKNNGNRYEILSALLFGLAVLTRTSALFAAPIFFTRKFKSLCIWSSVVLMVCGYWYYLLYSYYGTPFYFPNMSSAAKDNLNLSDMFSRPWYDYILDLIYLTPVCLFSLFNWKMKYLRLSSWIFLYIFIFSILTLSGKALGVEDRYLLPCYASLAILSAEGLNELAKRTSYIPPFIILVATGVWSLRIAYFLVITRESLKFVPW